MSQYRALLYTLLVPAALAFLAACDALHGSQADRSDQDLRDFGDRIMQAVANGDLQTAYGTMAMYSVLSSESVSMGARASIEQRDEDFIARYGRTTGYEFVGQQKASDSLRRMLYLEKTERHPLVWQFVFYRTDTGWVLAGFGWNDDIAAVFRGGP